MVVLSLRQHTPDDRWVVDMDQFVAYALDPYALDPYALDQEEVLVNQFQLFPLQFLPLMMETVVIVHKCCLYANVVVQELNGLYVILSGYAHRIHDHQLVF